MLQIKNLTKQFSSPFSHEPLVVLSDIEFSLQTGDTVAIVGQSGSGKSTLLSLLAGLDRPNAGSIELKSRDIAQMTESQLIDFRAQNIGIIFQQFHLMPHFSAVENVALPLELTRQPNPRQSAEEALRQVGLSERMHHLPHQLSGGECQRVAIARALVVKPALLLADEPTGNLDQENGNQVADLLFDLVQANGSTLILVTHNLGLANRCQRQLHLKQGRLLPE